MPVLSARPGPATAPLPLPPDGPGTPLVLDLRDPVVDGTVLVDVGRWGAATVWELYRSTCAHRRRGRPARRPELSPEGVAAMLADPRVEVFAVAGGHGPTGMVTVSQDLATAPATARAHLEGRWPQTCRTGRLWYVGLLLLAPQATPGAVGHLFGGVWARAAAEGGLVAVDTAGVGQSTVAVPSLLHGLAREFMPGAGVQHLADERVWAYDFPAPRPL